MSILTGEKAHKIDRLLDSEDPLYFYENADDRIEIYEKPELGLIDKLFNSYQYAVRRFSEEIGPAYYLADLETVSELDEAMSDEINNSEIRKYVMKDLEKIDLK